MVRKVAAARRRGGEGSETLPSPAARGGYLKQRRPEVGAYLGEGHETKPNLGTMD